LCARRTGNRARTRALRPKTQAPWHNQRARKRNRAILSRESKSELIGIHEVCTTASPSLYIAALKLSPKPNFPPELPQGVLSVVSFPTSPIISSYRKSRICVVCRFCVGPKGVLQAIPRYVSYVPFPTDTLPSVQVASIRCTGQFKQSRVRSHACVQCCTFLLALPPVHSLVACTIARLNWALLVAG
jgi:hypothetical protein